MEIIVQRNLDLTVIQRDGYTIMDYLSDIGGISNIIYNFFFIFLSLWNYKYIEDHLVSNLFRLSDEASISNSEV